MTIDAEFKIFWDVRPYEINTKYEGKRSYIVPLGAIIPNFNSGGGATAWGSITGNIDNQTDLKFKLDSKQDTLPTNGDGSKFLSNDGSYKAIDIDAGDFYTKEETNTLLSDKVDKEVGKGLSTNDYTNIDKSKVDNIVTNGIGDKYLSDDGSYKEVSGGGGGGGVSEVEVKGWISRNIAVNNAYESLVTPPSADTSAALALCPLAEARNTNSIAIGTRAKATHLESISIGTSATSSGNYAITLGNMSKSAQNGVAIGPSASAPTTGVSIGLNAISPFAGSTCLGARTTTTATYQVQLGESITTTYAYGAVQDRSDARDKTDIQDCTLGLDFINALRPVKYKWDYREDYARDLFPLLNREDYESDEAYQSALEQQQNDRCAFFENPVKDGSKTRIREHHGLIAQEFKQVLDNLGIDHAAYQDHSVNGGMCVKSMGYVELIPNLIKAIQDLSAKVESLENSILPSSTD